MNDVPKLATEMSPEEYRAARAKIIRAPPPGLTAEELADLAARRAGKSAATKSAIEMTREEFAAAKQKAIRDSYR